ncbi:hypothetical protein [Levilactobacillus enshiensis]|uniref:hypothetical protein n=1 Tax=Levilactobacillus enshiensis TaxID=2590213 RepID=UPI00117AFD69|nr:hypothetical protein [Levilactobacillus enshiensis]
MYKFLVRYETKAWYEVEVMADTSEDAVAQIQNAEVEELERLTADKRLEDEDLTPLDIQVVDQLKEG